MSDKPSLLKLRAADVEDLQVVSAVLQDAIAPVCDIMFDAAEKHFVMVVHRLRRETETGAKLERVCCAVNVKGVENVQTHGIDLSRQGQMFDLLAVMPEKNNAVFLFAGDAKLRLQLGEWSMIVEDFGESWPASVNPCHDQQLLSSPDARAR